MFMFQHLWQMLVQDADLLSHLRIIKDFYLLGRGELYLAFIDQSQHLLRVPATANTEHGKLICYAQIQRRDIRSGTTPHPPPPPPPTPRKLQSCRVLYKIINTGPEPIENHKATKPAFNVGPPSACQQNAI